MRLVVALGGNALLHRGERPDAATQEAHVRAAAGALASIAAQHELVLCHGNGPQIGVLADESVADDELARPFPLDALGAQTQGMIGYWLARELANAGVTAPVAVLVTQTVVDPDDPAFDRPTKFIGPVWTRDRADELAARHGWRVAPDGTGWRRVVPSPRPRAVVEERLIARLLDAGAVVVCCGGGGTPVTDGLDRRGVEAVIDKDLTAALVAIALDADRLVILTDVPGVMQGWGTPAAHVVERLTLEDLAGTQFADGSMGPKVEACRRFVSTTGRPAIIGSLEHAAAVIAGRGGTLVTADRTTTFAATAP